MNQLQEIIDEIKARTKTTTYSLKIVKDSQPDIFDSKFGGIPYWGRNKEYPIDKEGNKMMLLAQINFDRAENDDRLPQQGMLQFFIGTDDVYGLDFDQPDAQETFRVVYHEEIDYSVSKEEILRMNLPHSSDPDYEEFSPVFKEAVVEIIKTETYMGPGDYRFEDLLRAIVKEKSGEDIESIYDFLGDDGYEKIEEESSNQGHHILGYPYFTQYDPREHNEQHSHYDTLLFQMDSDMIDHEDYVLWGDCGVANFFINQEDLKKRDFSKVLYNWDCC